MFNLNFMYAELKKLTNYKDNNEEVLTYLNSAYNSLKDACNLSNYFLIDDRQADNNEIVKQSNYLLALINNVKEDNSRIQYELKKQRQTIKNEEYRIEHEKANLSQEGK